MSAGVVPVDQCDVEDKPSLAQYRTKMATWERWFRTDPHHALWPLIYSMLVGDLTYRTLAAAAEVDQESALHSPIIARGLLQGYAATQGLAIRRLVDPTSGTISLRRLLIDLKRNQRLLTRENYVSGDGVAYNPDAALAASLSGSDTTGFWASITGATAFAPSLQAHARFDILSGVKSDSRSRTDRIRIRLIDILCAWLDAPEIKDVVTWSNNLIAHSADQAAQQRVVLAQLAPTIATISTAHRYIVRTAEALSGYLLNLPIHGNLIPVFQQNQFARFDVAFRNPAAVTIAKRRWKELANERDEWTRGIWDDLTI